MRVVIDTNVLISGIFFSGPPAEILDHWKKRAFLSVISEPIIIEYVRVAEEISRKFPPIKIAEILDLFILHSEIVDTNGIEIKECEDPDDDKFLECAVAGGCQIIVSGDKHLLNIAKYQEVKILKPRNFLDQYVGRRE